MLTYLPQASVPHEDLATLIASLSLCSTLASSVGSTIATSIWQEKMLPAMREEAPLGTSDSTLRTIYGSIRDLRTDYGEYWKATARAGG